MTTGKTEDILREIVERRIVLLDGAYGTMLQRHKLVENDFRGERFEDHLFDLQGNNDLFILTRLDLVRGVHESYLAAGSDIIEINTFSATVIAQADYKLESIVYELNLEG